MISIIRNCKSVLEYLWRCFKYWEGVGVSLALFQVLGGGWGIFGAVSSTGRGLGYLWHCFKYWEGVGGLGRDATITVYV